MNLKIQLSLEHRWQVCSTVAAAVPVPWNVQDGKDAPDLQENLEILLDLDDLHLHLAQEGYRGDCRRWAQRHASEMPEGWAVYPFFLVVVRKVVSWQKGKGERARQGPGPGPLEELTEMDRRRQELDLESQRLQTVEKAEMGLVWKTQPRRKCQQPRLTQR
jgi:hypothetical protein